MKHKHHDMICAKAANMDLVIFAKYRKEWIELPNEAIGLNESWHYFACLPQHAEICLHWLNGGGVLVDNHDMICASISIKWDNHRLFMNEETDIKIKPRTEKRWIGVLSDDKGRMVNTTFQYKSIEKLKRDACAPRGFDHWQFIEIEVEVK